MNQILHFVEFFRQDDHAVSTLLDSLRLHNNVKVRLNGRELHDDFDLSFKLRAGDVVAVFDQPESGGLIKTLLNPVEHLNPIRFTKKVMSGLTGQQTASSPSISTAESNPDIPGTDHKYSAFLYTAAHGWSAPWHRYSVIHQ